MTAGRRNAACFDRGDPVIGQIFADCARAHAVLSGAKHQSLRLCERRRRGSNRGSNLSESQSTSDHLTAANVGLDA
jgi:hypothetical protein